MTSAVVPIDRSRLIHYSPTQLSKYGLPIFDAHDRPTERRSGCRRKWWFEYVLKAKPPKTASQQKGSRGHGVVENAIPDGRVVAPGTEIVVDKLRGQRAVVDEDDVRRGEAALRELARIESLGDADDLESQLVASVAQRGVSLEELLLRLRRAHKEGLVHVECAMSIELPPTALYPRRAYVGNVDLLDLRRPELPVVTDYKFLSDLRYARTGYELVEDLQMLSYGYWAFGFLQAPRVKLRHISTPTRGGAKPQTSSCVVERAHVEHRWSRYLPVLEEMDHVRQLGDPADVPPDGYANGECDRYGGCPHRERCAGALFQRAQEGVQDMSDLQAKLQALRDRNAAQLAGNGAATPPAPVQLPPAEGFAKLKALAQVGSMLPTQPAIQAASAPSFDPMAKLRAVAPAKAYGPPDDLLPTQTVMPQPAPSAASNRISVPQPAPHPASTASNRISVLFVDCAPTQGIEAVDFLTWVAPILEVIRSQTGAGWQHHKYREGTALVCDGVATTPAPQYLAIDTRSPVAQVALEALVPRADVVVRGRP